MSGVCTTDSDVIFVSARCPRRGQEIICDQARRRALQRDVDLQSQPEQPAGTNQRSAAVERPAERMEMKVEGERSEEKLVKKEKKLKKELASVFEDNNCTVDDESQAGVKKEKKKKKKKDQKVFLEDGGDKREEKKKKKKEVGSESLNEANTSDVKTENNEEEVKKKKKTNSVKGDKAEKKQRKEVKNKSVSVKPEHVKVEEEEPAGKDKLPKKVKKEVLDLRKEETEVHVKEKKKKRKKEETTEEETTEDMNGKSVTKKKNKSKTKVENGEKFEKPEEDDGDVVEVKVKKKKKKDAQIVEDENEVITPQIKGNKKKSKEEEGESTKCETAAGEEGETLRKKKGKKEKGGKASVEVSEVEETEPKKKKRKKGSLKAEEDELLSVKCEEDEERTEETPLRGAKAATKKKAKKKKSCVNVETLMESVSLESEVKKKKKKIKEEVVDQRESPHVDVVFLSEKSGNADEVTINQERRQALQMEIDEASQPEKTAKPPRLGQWSTAQFDSSEQQQKFLRLMGGFKKGFHSATGSPGGANMALGKEAQQQLQQGLLGEFERAHTRRMDFNNRGAGLGFAAPSNKKFSIDINKCRSVRFDD